MGVQLQLLGRPHIRLAGESLGLPSGKASALLAFLAYQQDWVPRSDIRYLFWPDSEEHKASNNLRQLLKSLQHLPYVHDLERQSGRLRWSVATDLQAFRSAIRDNHWAAALSSYQGELLAGFSLQQAPEFENWLAFERESLAGQWRSAVMKLCAELERSQRFDQVALLFERLLDADPYDEDIVQRSMRLACTQHESIQALRTYQQFRERLKRELGEEPSYATALLAEHIRSGQFTNDGVQVAISILEPKRLRLPRQNSPFVGREQELRDLQDKLLQPDVQLLSIVAPGGMGKTRLALAVAEGLEEQFQDGVAFVSFTATINPQQMLSTLATGLEFSFYGQDEPKTQLLSYLSHKEMLLILDNLEHLVQDSSLIVELLHHCPRLKLLVTSRELLALNSEYSYTLQGLQYPDSSAEKDGNLLHYDAIVYFSKEAQHHHAATPDPREISRLCRLVEGMPLALTLAAAWLRVLALSDIITELQQDFSLLQTDAPDLPERHRSMRSVFTATWQRLKAVEQTAWAQLSVFEDGFTREAAQRIFGISLPQLLSLSNKALISRQADRFTQHPLVQQYGREQARALDLWETSQEQHAQYYSTLLKQQGEALKGAEQKQSLSLLAQELANLRAAWQQALQTQAFKRLAVMAPVFARYYDILALWQDKEALFKEAIATLEKASISKDQQIALARALPHAAENHALWLKQTEQSLALAERWGDKLGCATAHMLLCDCGTVSKGQAHLDAALQLFAELGDSEGMMMSYRRFSWFLTVSGFYKEAAGYLQQARELGEQVGNTIELALILNDLCALNIFLGNFDDAKTLVLKAQTLLQGLKLPYMSNSIGWLEHWRGNFTEAQSHIEAFVKALEAVGDISIRSWMYSEFYYSQGKYDEAARLAEEFLALQKQKQIRILVTGFIEGILSRIRMRQGDLVQAKVLLQDAFLISQEKQAPRALLEIAVAIAELSVHQGKADLASHIIGFVQQHPITDFRTKWEIEQLHKRMSIEPQSSNAHDLTWLAQVLEEILAE